MPQANTPPASVPKWYTIRAQAAARPQGAQAAAAASTAEVFIYGDIGESWFGDTVTAAEFCQDFAAIAAPNITVRINSYGGSVSDGIAIYNAIKRHPANITTSVDAMAASIASLIAMAGNTVEIAENSTLMVHAPWGGVKGNAANLREYADMLEVSAAAMATSYAAKTGKPLAEMLALLQDGKDHWYTAAQAVEAGFADTVITASPQALAARASFDLSRFSAPAPHLTRAQLSVAAATLPLETPMTTNVNSPSAAATPTAPATAHVTAPAAALDHTAIAQAALAADATRRADIKALFAKFTGYAGVSALLTTCEADYGITPQAAGQRLLDHIGQNTSPVAGVGVSTIADETDVRIEGQAKALMARAMIKTKDGVVHADTSNPFRGQSLYDLARASAQRAGFNTDGMDKMKVVATAFTQSTSDFPVLLENVMYKTLLAAYSITPDTWRQFCAVGSVSDFRANNRYMRGSLGNMLSKTELGEYRTLPIPDGAKSSIRAATKGFIINVSRETVIDDDLGFLNGLTTDMGRSARRTIEVDVYAMLALNSGMGPTMPDGLSLFHASHNNVTTGAPTIASFDAARIALLSQKDISGNDFLAIQPALWLGPLGIAGAARTVVNSEYDPDTANKLQRYNTARNVVGTVLDTPRLTGTPWYFFASPTEVPVLEVAFLDGNDTPRLDMEPGFSVDGTSWKVSMDYGVAARDYRGAVRSTGA